MNKIIALLGIVVVGGALVVFKLIGKETDDNSAVTRKETPVMSSGDQPRSKDTDSKEAQGEDGRKVSARVSYNNPAGEDEVGVTLTLNKEGVIIATATEVLAAHEISKKRQESFASELTATLQGKKLSELTAIDRVGGSSLTTMAFNQALPQLKAQL